jgi:hypothetical protein
MGCNSNYFCANFTGTILLVRLVLFVQHMAHFEHGCIEIYRLDMDGWQQNAPGCRYTTCSLVPGCGEAYTVQT